MALGVDSDSAITYANHVVAWRTPLTNGQSDPEAAFYQEADRNYGPRHGPFQDVHELGLVADIPPQLIDRVMPYLTVYSGRPEVNVLGAASQVLAALPGLTPERLQLLLSLRAGSPQDVMRAQFGTATSYVTLEPSPANRVTVSVRFPNGDQIRSEAVILLLDSDKQPYSVLWWDDGESFRAGGASARELVKAPDPIRNAFWRWLNLVAETIVSGLDRMTAKRRISLAESSEDHFAVTASDHDAIPDVGEIVVENGNISVQQSAQLGTMLRGGSVELLLRPERFVFKPLELPSRAAEFLDGVVRAQIDRLTPWTADQAAFGFEQSC